MDLGETSAIVRSAASASHEQNPDEYAILAAQIAVNDYLYGLSGTPPLR